MHKLDVDLCVCMHFQHSQVFLSTVGVLFMPSHRLTITEACWWVGWVVFPCRQRLKVTLQLLPQLLRPLTHKASPARLHTITGRMWLKQERQLNACERVCVCVCECDDNDLLKPVYCACVQANRHPELPGAWPCESTRPPVCLKWMTSCVYMYLCTFVLYQPSLPAALWTALEFKASSFSSWRKCTDLHLFFLPPLFWWPHHTWGDKTISDGKVQNRMTLSLDMESSNSC